MLMLRIDLHFFAQKEKYYYNTVLRNFPLFCPKCKLTHIVDVEKLEIIIKNSEKQTF